MRQLLPALLVLLIASGCGGGGGSSSSAAPIVGGLTLLLGDGPLDGVAEVNIVVTAVTLIGDSGQRELSSINSDPINLLDLRNLTASLVSAEVLAGSYSKIRLTINSLEIVEADGSREFAQLPANGKIDLNPQGPFDIVGGEDLVIEIDLDLDRSVQIVQTGNSKYKFRPVVFVEVIDQTDNLRLTRLFGTIQDGDNDQILLCDPLDADQCNRLDFSANALLLDSLGATASLESLSRGGTAWAFGHFAVNSAGQEVVEVVALAVGDESSLEQIDGTTGGAIVGDEFELFSDDEEIPTTVALVDDAKLLDALGQPLTTDAVAGDEVEAWAQVVVLEDAEAEQFPAFLVQVKPASAEDGVSGILAAINGDELLLNTPNNGQACAIFTSETEIQLVMSSADGAETNVISLADLTERVSDELAIEVFGEQVNDCIEAELIVAEVG